MTLVQAIVLGLLQGLTEFLPVSSSAHLALAPWMFGWTDPGLAFDVALHAGTLLALLWYFRADWMELLRAAWSIVSNRRIQSIAEKRVVMLILGTVPAGLAGLFLNDYAENAFRTPALIASALMAMGVILWAVDRWAPAARTLDESTMRDGLLIGLAQMCALVPGVSRSGSTMTAGRALGLDRRSAAHFSFLLSMPITMAAVMLKLPEAFQSQSDLAPLIAGIVSAAVSGWLAITVLLRFVARHSFGIFAGYRLVLGVVVFALVFARG